MAKITVPTPLDFVTVGGSSVNVFVGSADGSGALTFGTSPGEAVRDVALGDVNGDGKTDLVFTSDHVLNATYGNGAGAFVGGESYSISGAPGALAVGDLTGDGVAEIVVAQDDQLVIYSTINNGPTGLVTTYGVTDQIRELVLADMDGDGILDAVTGDAAGRVSIWQGNGEGVFNDGLAIQEPSGQAVDALKVADLNGDGVLDVVEHRQGQFLVDLHLSTGEGEFLHATVNPGVSGLTSLAVGDVDGDGDVDLVANSGASGAVGVLLNDGTGAFLGTYVFAVDGALDHVTLADVNGDGKLDIVGSIGSDAAVLFGKGDGTFSDAAVSTPTGAPVTDVAVAQLGGSDGAASTAEDTNLTFSTANGNAITVTADNAGSPVYVSISATHGELLIGTPAAGVTVSHSGEWLLVSGPASLVTQTLDGLTYHPAADYAGADALIINVAENGIPPTSSRIDLVVTPVNDAPTVTIGSAGAGFAEGGAGVAIAPNVALADVDSGSLTGATITLTDHQTGDSLGFVNQNGISGSYDAATGVLTLTGTATVADYQAAVRSIQFSTPSDDPGAGRSFTMTVGDGAAVSQVATGTIAIAEQNDAPSIVLQNASGVFAEDGAPVDVFKDVSISGVESGQTIIGFDLNVYPATDAASVVLNVDGTDVVLKAGQTGTTAGHGLSYVVIQEYFSGPRVAFTSAGVSAETAAAIIDGVTYRNVSDNPLTGHSIAVSNIEDSAHGVSDGVSASGDVAVTPTNDAPHLDVNSNERVLGPGALDLVASTLLHATDPEQDASQITYTVTAMQHGYLILGRNALSVGQTFTQRDIDNYQVTFQHDQTGGAGSFTFDLSDGQGGVTENQTFHFQAAFANDRESATGQVYVSYEDAASALAGLRYASSYFEFIGETHGEGEVGASALTVFADAPSDFTINLVGDSQTLTLAGTGGVKVNGNGSAEHIIGNDGANELTGGGGADTLSGGAGADTLIGGEGDDVLDGGAGFDSFVGGAGHDVVSYASSASGLTISLRDPFESTGDALGDSFSGIEEVRGSGGSDRIYGTSAAETIDGGLGADTMAGGDGDDTYYVNTSIDVVIENSGEGVDTILTTRSYFLNDAYLVEVLRAADPSATTVLALGGNKWDNTIIGASGDDTLRGGGGADTLEGGAGADSLEGGDGSDTASYAGSVGNVIASLANNAAQGDGDAWGDRFDSIENLAGGRGSDILIGDGSSNRLYGGAGSASDSLYGGGGDDYLYGGEKSVADAEGDGPDLFDGGDGTDWAVYTDLAGIVASLADITRNTGSAAGDHYVAIEALQGGYGADSLEGNAGDNALFGGYDLGNTETTDTLSGGLGGDTYFVADHDVIVELAGEGDDSVYAMTDYTLEDDVSVEHLGVYAAFVGSAAINLTGNNLANEITGSVGVNVLRGGAGNDTIDGGAGADTMYGGAGDDTFYVDHAGDLVIEASDEGDDLVISTVSYALTGQYVQDLRLAGTGDTNATGNSLRNHIWGNAGANIIDGGTDADTMEGGAGDDVYYVQNKGDRVIELKGEGSDLIYSTVSYALTGQYVEKLTLTGSGDIDATGNTLRNYLTGNAGSNVLDGGTDADTMAGGLGNDTYYVQNTGDKVIELDGEGADQVYSSVTYSLKGQYVEALTLTGSADIDATGNTLANVLTGNDGINTLAGGKGDDEYYIQTAGDKVLEAKGEGYDIVHSSVTYALTGEYVEELRLSGTADIDGRGNTLDNVLIGNAGKNVLTGGSGNDTLDGGSAGADTLAGGSGNDVYYVDHAGVQVLEAQGAGTDIVYSTVSFALTGQYIETLQLTGVSAIDGLGNTRANTIIGNDGDNLINGWSGMDTLEGGLGADTFVFSNKLAADNVDTIRDFRHGEDVIRLDAAAFKGLTADVFTSDMFWSGDGVNAAHDATDRILYDTASGALFFDRDGSGSTYAAVQFATLTGNPNDVDFTDFRVV